MKLGLRDDRRTIIIPISSNSRMQLKSNLFSPSRNLDSLLAAVIAFVIIQVFSKHSGIGISPDSVTYLAASRHMVHGLGFISFDNQPVVDFPFAYPFLLTIISFISRLDVLQFAPLLNGILFGGLLYLSGSIMNGFNKSSGWYKRILLLCFLFSPALQEVYSMLWSETVFIILILLFIPAINNYLKFNSRKWLLISAAICAISCLTRYAGVFMMLTGGTITFFNTGKAWSRRIIDCLIFGFLSIPFLLINVIRNYYLTGLATGIRPRSEVGIFKIMEYFGGVICDWLLIERRPGLSIFLTVLVLILFAVIVVYCYLKNTIRGLNYVIAMTGLLYVSFMLFSYSITRYEPFTSRLIAPIFIPLLWSLSSWIPGLVSENSIRMKWLIVVSTLILTALFMNKQLTADWEYYDGVRDAGVPGYREDPFVKTEIVQFLEKNINIFDPRVPIFSNAGDAVYFVTGLPAGQLPFTDFPKKSGTVL